MKALSVNNLVKDFPDNRYPAVNDISFSLELGEILTLVGPSGCGKTTTLRMIAGLEQPDEGEVWIKDTLVSTHGCFIPPEQRGLGMVFQDHALFPHLSVFNNIAFGEYNIPEEDVIRAAKIANAHEFIEKTPLGYYTNIGDRGNKLSGGQRQRLSIARAVLKNPPLLILDEATSALDTESEKLVQQALSNIMKNRTSVVIAHRLSTVINADLICVIHEGKIVERGSHDELIQKNGYYKKLHGLQMFAE